MPTAMPPVPALQAYARAVQVAPSLRLFAYIAGAPSAPPLVLIHGLGDEADSWRHIFPLLAERYYVIAPDLPGFGRSDQPRRAYTNAFFAQTIAQLLTALAIPRATLVGSSMGAAIAQRLALAQPERVERLVLLDGGLPLEQRLPSIGYGLFLLPGLGEAMYTSLRFSQDQAYNTLAPYYANLAGLPAEDRAFLRDRVWARVWQRGQRRAFLSALRWFAIESIFRLPTLRQRLPALHTPTLLLWGEQDQIVPSITGEALARILPNARLAILPNAGHLPHQEQPAAVVRAIG